MENTTTAGYRQKLDMLKQYKDNKAEALRLEEELAFWRSRAEMISPLFSHAPGSTQHSGSRMERALEQIVEMEEMLEESLCRAVRLRHQMDEAIATVPDPTHRRVLVLRYVDGLLWPDIARQVGYSRAHLFRVHQKAVENMRLSGT